jgi:ADP-heptose:LPS heptosyltransferase
MSRILVIRLGALGDFIQSFPPFAAIRGHHATDHITLLTTAPFAALAARAPWFDAIRLDPRPAWWNLRGLRALRRQLRGFDLVYDLQTSARSSRYFWLAGRPRWSGIAPGCALPHANPRRDFMHTSERQREQLAMAGISTFPAPELAWLTGGAPPAGIAPPYAVLAPGAAPHRPEKRWPAALFGEVAALLAARGTTPLVIGSAAEAPLAAEIRARAPEAIDLTGRTTLADLGPVLAGAALVIGNDTGPMHLATLLGRPAIVLFSSASDPAITAPRYPDGGWPVILAMPDLADLPVARVAAALP